MTNSSASLNKKQLFPWWPVFILILMAIAIRAYITSSPYHYILAGADGPYMLLQTRSMLEHFRLAIPDMPLLFALGAGLAKILQWLHIATEGESVLLSVRIVDALLPPLAAIPVFLIGREIWDTGKHGDGMSEKLGDERSEKSGVLSGIPFYLMVCYAVLNFTPLVIFSYQLQKNALATVWVFLFLYYVIRLIKYTDKNDFIKALIVLAFCAFTHFGSFGILLFFSLVIKIWWFANTEKGYRKSVLKNAWMAGLAFLAILIFLIVRDPARFQRLVSIPLKLFEGPVLLFALAGQNFLLKGFTLIVVGISNLLAVVAIIIIFRNRKSMDRVSMNFGYAMSLCTILLASPLLGLEWANRLFMLAYIPLVVLYMIVFNVIENKWFRVRLSMLFVGLISLSLMNALFSKPPMSISENAYKSFRNLGILFIQSDVIVGRQDLRLLGSWEHRTKGVPQYMLTKDEFTKYHAVYFIRQVSGKNPGLRDPEPEIPVNASPVYHDEYFEVFRLNDSKGLRAEKLKPFRGVRGIVVEVIGQEAKVKDEKSGIIKTIHLPKDHLQLSPGMKVEINGSWRPFSLTIDAETIQVIDK